MRRADSLRLLPVAVALGLVGCSGPERGAEKIAVYPVAGKLVVLDRPAANAHIVFHPLDKTSTGGRTPVGVTGADGTFRMTTHAHDDGAPAGAYAVTVLWINDAIPFDPCGDPVSHDRLCGAYLDPAKSPLRATVRPEHNEITLHATIGVGGTGWNLPRLKDTGKQERDPLRDPSPPR